MFKRIAAFFRALLEYLRGLRRPDPPSLPPHPPETWRRTETSGELETPWASITDAGDVVLFDRAEQLAKDNVYVAVPADRLMLPDEIPVYTGGDVIQLHPVDDDDDDRTPVETPSLKQPLEPHPNAIVAFPAPAADPSPEELPAPVPTHHFAGDAIWGRWAGPMVVIPRGYREALKIYGNPAKPDGTPDATWERKQMILLKDLPGIWNNSPRNKCKVFIHRLVAPYFVEFLERLERAGMIDEIRTLGTYNFRRKRHSTDPKTELSIHSFGAAHDLNGTLNRAWYRTKPGTPRNTAKRQAPIPAPFAKGWRDVWPQGLSQQLVECAESVGYQWGGRWRTFCDPMHIQLVIE
jgi:hypothetical protein